MCEYIDMNEFDNLSVKEQELFVTKALAWFCVLENMHPYFAISNAMEIAVIKIILGKFGGIKKKDDV